MDKDQGQLPYWPHNEELGVAGDNFFDQFVTFDGTDPTVLSGGGNLLDDPPSPSMLLDSLTDSLTNSSSSNDQDTQSGQSQSEVAATSASFDLSSILPSDAPALENSHSVPPEFTDPLLADPVLSGGSISDSELLRLEGISIKSPKSNATAPSSPPFVGTTSRQGPRKHSRVIDSIYNTFRRATHRSKPQKLQDSPHIRRNGESNVVDRGNICYDISNSVDLQGFADIKLEEMPGPIDEFGMPLSPPLTGRIPADHHSNGTMGFANGHLDDPFYDGLLGPPAAIHPAKDGHDLNLHTPMDTPALNDDPFYQNSMATIDINGSAFRPQSKQRNTSSAEWPMEGILTNDNTSDVWSSSAPGTAPVYVSEGIPSSEWWDTTPQPKGRPHGHTRNGHHSHNGVRTNASLNLPMHNQQADLNFEYGNDADIAGLMIHMPQPRGPQAAVLNPNMNDDLMSPSSNYYSTPSGHRQPSALHRGHHTERRPRPRAPSSGARHHGSMTSPRKMSSCYALREEPPSPTPTSRHRSASSGSSTALAVRKRRSWTRRQGQGQGQEPRTPTARSASYDAQGSRRGSGHSSAGSLGGGGSLSIEFCNYTPSDKKVLMNGVAPSGSSKTKARREKEAQEHKRKMSQAYIEAIRAAGGDVDKLRQVEQDWFY
ncbi:hypothetical protein F4819DRAFT_496365 [Hypoxylon fuscum]|nr:hypothetical protein F4819DRAFT_496365 [Hypoxylon fuscum]